MKTKIQEDAPYTFTLDQLQPLLSDCKVENWSSNDDSTTITFFDTDDRIGVFRRSDFTIVYNKEGLPGVICERVKREFYSFFEWLKLVRQLRAKQKYLHQEYGFDIAINITRSKIDFTHYREDRIRLQRVSENA